MIDEALGDVVCAYVVLSSLARAGEDHLMQDRAVVGQVVVTVQQSPQIVGVQHRLAGDGAQTIQSQRSQVGVSAQQHPTLPWNCCS